MSAATSLPEASTQIKTTLLRAKHIAAGSGPVNASPEEIRTMSRDFAANLKLLNYLANELDHESCEFEREKIEGLLGPDIDEDICTVCKGSCGGPENHLRCAACRGIGERLRAAS